MVFMSEAYINLLGDQTLNLNTLNIGLCRGIYT